MKNGDVVGLPDVVVIFMLNGYVHKQNGLRLLFTDGTPT